MKLGGYYVIKPGQTLHITYTGERHICTRVVPPNSKNKQTETYYYFRDLSFPIKHSQIQSALRRKVWIVED